MWILTARSPDSQIHDYKLRQGRNTLGRKPDNQVIIADESASRVHAEIYCQNNLAVLQDLDSTNGTFVNRARITEPHILRVGDQIRIGGYAIFVIQADDGDPTDIVKALSGTRPFTRELLLESIDQHAIFLDAVASRLTKILDLDSALQETAEIVQMAVGADFSRVIRVDQIHLLEEDGLPSFIARQTIELRSVIVIPDLASHCNQIEGEEIQTNIHSVLSVPILIDQEVVALLYACKRVPIKRHFDQHDVQLTVAISHQVALTIQRAKLLKESRMFEQLAITDSLTGIHNRRQILHLAELEYKRAKRFQHPLSLVMLDVDDLKQINDHYGHLVGDQALQAVSETGKKQIREVDSFGRLSGDEFLIVLVETDRDGGLATAERIRQNIDAISIDTPSGILRISVSIGIATLNEKTKDLTDLLFQVDNSLLKVKKNGKNQIGIAN